VASGAITARAAGTWTLGDLACWPSRAPETRSTWRTTWPQAPCGSRPKRWAALRPS